MMTRSEITNLVVNQFPDAQGWDRGQRDSIIRACIQVRNTTQQKIEFVIEELKKTNNN